MTFPEYYQKCQDLITERVELPFDVPFTKEWVSNNHSLFHQRFLNEMTVEQAVSVHFWWIEMFCQYQCKTKTKKK